MSCSGQRARYIALAVVISFIMMIGITLIVVGAAAGMDTNSEHMFIFFGVVIIFIDFTAAVTYGLQYWNQGSYNHV